MRKRGTRMLKKFRNGSERVINLIYPRRCPVCDEIVTGGSLICPECKRAVRFHGDACCEICGRTLSIEERQADALRCGACEEIAHDFDYAMPVFTYRSMADSIYRFKYRGRREYASFYAAAAIYRHGDALRALKIDAIVPVPLHPKREHQRGYNQARDFARALSRASGIPMRADVVRRVRNTPRLKGSDHTKRRFLLKNAFNIRKNDVKLKRILIVDDIYTTGSTADELAALLKRHGARHIYVMTVAA